MPAGVSATGLEIKTVEQINEEISNAQLTSLGSDLDTSPDQPLGQLNGIVATKLAELWELAQTAYNAFNPAAAEGYLLDIIGLLRGVPRLSATFGSVNLQVTLDLGTTLVGGVSTANVAGQSANRWILVSNFTAPFAGNHTLAFRSELPGRQIANPGTITEITTATAGWNAVTNPQVANSGREIESDSDYRIRMQELLSAPGATTVDAIRADLQALPNMLQVSVFENTSDFFDDLGLPPHSFEAVIRDESLIANTAIAQSLWLNKPAGIATHGSTTANATDALGVARPVKFSRATPVSLNVEFEVDVLPGWSPGQIAEIQQDVVEFFQTLRVGENVVVNRIRNIIMAQPFAWDATLVKINVITTSGSFPIGPREYAVLNSVNGIINQLSAVP